MGAGLVGAVRRARAVRDALLVLAARRARRPHGDARATVRRRGPADRDVAHRIRERRHAGAVVRKRGSGRRPARRPDVRHFARMSRPRRYRCPPLVRAFLVGAAGLWCATAAAVTEHVEIRIDGVDKDVEENVRSYLTLTRYVTRDDLTDGQVRRLADKAVDEAADALRPFGYYSPTIRSRTSRDEPNWIVRLKIQPGKPVKLTTVDLQLAGAGRDDPELKSLIAQSPLKVGDRLDHPTYDKFKADLMRTAQERGYLDAQYTRRELRVNTREVSGEAHLELDTGGRYEFGAGTVEQHVLDAGILAGYVRVVQGQPYSLDKLHAT